MRKELSVIIPFLNEGEEIYNTLDSLFSTIDGNKVEVIVIDDCSDKSYNRISDYDVKYVKNRNRMGVAESRTLGVSMASSEIAVLFDSHMRFPNGWSDRVIDEVSKSPESVFCTSCAALDEKHKTIQDPAIIAYGATLPLVGEKNSVLDPKWIPVKKRDAVYDIPCILGASYSFNISKFNHLRGLKGLMSWGGDEPYLSLKYWMSGGSCKIISDVVIGHIFRSNKFPYFVPSSHVLYNKIFICITLMPDGIAAKLVQRMPQDDSMSDAAFLFRRNMSQIFEYKRYYGRVLTRTFSQVCEMLNMQIPDA